MTIEEVQAKTETIKAHFLELANQFEAETGTHLHLSVHHAYKAQSEILTCDVKVPDAGERTKSNQLPQFKDLEGITGLMKD